MQHGVCMYVSGKYRKEPVSVVAYAVEPHNGGQVPPLGPHHIGPAVLSTDTAGAGGAHGGHVRTHARTELVCWW